MMAMKTMVWPMDKEQWQQEDEDEDVLPDPTHTHVVLHIEHDEIEEPHELLMVMDEVQALL